MTISDIATIMVALATAGSLLYISRQVNVTRLQTKGQFLLALDDQFEKFTMVSVRVINEPDFVPTGEEWLEVWRVMSVFERINIMVEDKILDVGLVDRLYGFRLLSIIENDAIYGRVQSSGAEWQDFIDLCRAVADHRRRLGADLRDAAFAERVSRLNKLSRTLRNPFGF